MFASRHSREGSLIGSHRRDGLGLVMKFGHDERNTNQLRGMEIGGGPRPTGFFGLSVPT